MIGQTIGFGARFDQVIGEQLAVERHFGPTVVLFDGNLSRPRRPLTA